MAVVSGLTAYTIEDLVPDVSLSYVCRYIHPFMDRDNWVHNLRDAVSKLENAGGRAVSDLAPDDTINDVLTDSLNYRGEPIQYRGRP